MATTASRGSSSTSSPRRSRARRGDGELLHAEILAAAERMLLETGDEAALSIRAIADAVGVTPPSIYLHFADRDELIFAVCEEQFRQLDAACQSAVLGLDDPLDRLKARGAAYIRFGLANPEHYRVLMMTRAAAMPERLTDERLAGTSAFGHLLADVEAAIGRGQLGSGDAQMVACGLWMMVHGVASLLVCKPGFPWPPVDQLIDHVLDVYCVGLQRQ